ncbi:MAG: radical SAM protein [Candidatus Omnitrophica bacterium]|nr:radical SAM protein [Candidatus Omnitrophota bacterium]
MSNDKDLRNFLFFLNEIKPLTSEDSLIGVLATSSKWEDVARSINNSRENDVFVQSIAKAHLYVHVPFCENSCAFCYCARRVLKQPLDIDAYITSLKNQMKFFSPVLKGMDTSTLCFGGGTPSILDESQLDTVLDALDKNFPVRERKILFEANPSSLSQAKLDVLVKRGLFRLSIGVQSLDEKIIKQVARFQTKKQVLWCVRSALKAGVPHVNADLIAGLPYQTVQGIKKDLKMLLDEGVNIVHVYPYCGKNLKALCAPSEEVLDFIKRRDAIIKTAIAILQKAGFKRKGLGSYALDSEGEEYQEELYTRMEAAVVGFGPLVMGQFPGSIFYRTRGLDSMSDFSGVDACPEDKTYVMSHFAAMAMITEGLKSQGFLKRFGMGVLDHCQEGLEYLKKQGLIACSKSVWKFTGPWEFERVREYVVLSRVLFKPDFLRRLRKRFISQYDPRCDYSKRQSWLEAYANNWLTTLYYRVGA